MPTLKELTAHNHNIAESHRFTKLLVSGTMPKQVYAALLGNQLLEYTALENRLHDFFVQIPGLARASNIAKDLTELDEPVSITKSSTAYAEYVYNCKTPELLLAHVYVKHMGDLYGGQLIKTKVPGKGSMYDFEDRANIIKQLREKLNVGLATEANHCFNTTLNLFTELADEYSI